MEGIVAEWRSQEVIEDLRRRANPLKVPVLSGFFKTGKGEYGEGDVFIGVTVPDQRAVAKRFQDIPLAQVRMLLQNKVHEHRLTGLLILVEKYKVGDAKEKEQVLHFYLQNLKRVNNWDLVDSSASYILGDYLLRADAKKATPLYRLVRSKNLWERRVAVVATFAFIRAGFFEHTLRLCGLLMEDDHDLMHKACGWMLREVGKRDEGVLKGFLDAHKQRMPRTMLRYAIERFDARSRMKYLALRPTARKSTRARKP